MANQRGTRWNRSEQSPIIDVGWNDAVVRPNDCESYARMDREKHADSGEGPAYGARAEGNSNNQRYGNRNQ